jgi:hypothetical protein
MIEFTLLLEINSVVVHFQGKTFNLEWVITGRLLAYQLFTHQKSHKQDVGGRAK